MNKLIENDFLFTVIIVVALIIVYFYDKKQELIRKSKIERVLAKAHPDTCEAYVTATKLYPTSDMYSDNKEALKDYFEDLEFMKNNIDTLFAEGFVSHIYYYPSKKDIEIAIANPNTKFARGIAKNFNFKNGTRNDMTSKLIEFSRLNPRTLFGQGLKENSLF